MKILNKIIQGFDLHQNYIEKVKLEKNKIKDWSDEQLKGYIDSYLNHGSCLDVFFGEPPRIEACVEVYGQRVTDNLYKPTN